VSELTKLLLKNRRDRADRERIRVLLTEVATNPRRSPRARRIARLMIEAARP
jgi:hypothetical protein